MDKFLNSLVTGTETYLTWRARRRHARKIKQAQKNVILDWVEAFIWSACVVLLVNQYAFQAYEIPSSSMEPTLLGNDQVHDRIFVNKFEYGPELLPGLFKIPGPVTPQRGEIIIFENPAYISQGPVFDVAQRLLYMLTLSLVDIDRDETGKAKAHFLIKRAIGYSGDVVRWRQGEPQFQLPGTDTWKAEADLKSAQGLAYGQHRQTGADLTPFYTHIAGASRALAASTLGQTADPADAEDLQVLQANHGFQGDQLEYNLQTDKALLAWVPQDQGRMSSYFRTLNGTWIPDGYLLPLGDNRDNSNDGRFFGPIPLNKILGGASFRYWPLNRAGGI